MDGEINIIIIKKKFFTTMYIGIDEGAYLLNGSGKYRIVESLGEGGSQGWVSWENNGLLPENGHEMGGL